MNEWMNDAAKTCIVPGFLCNYVALGKGEAENPWDHLLKTEVLCSCEQNDGAFPGCLTASPESLQWEVMSELRKPCKGIFLPRKQIA